MLSYFSTNESLRARAKSIYHQYIHDSPLLNPYQIDYTQDIHRGMLKEAFEGLPKQLSVFNPAQLLSAIIDYLRNGPGQPSWSLNMHISVFVLRNLTGNGFGNLNTLEDVAVFRQTLAKVSIVPTPWRAKPTDKYLNDRYRCDATQMLAQLNIDVSHVRRLSRTNDAKLGVVDTTLEPLHGEWIDWVENDENSERKTNDRNYYHDGHMAESKPGVILHLHGGAMIIGSSVSHRPLAWRMARDTGCRVFLPNYRLAPEDAYPSGLIDSLATYLWLIDDGPNGAGYSPEQVVIGGDSAGGCLAISLLYVLRDSLLKQPAGAYLWSPWVDITHSSKSWITNGQSDYLPNPRTTKTWRADDPDGREHFYVHKRSLMHSPYVSPLFGDADRLAPILVQTGAGERLIDECLEYGRKVNTANLKSGTPTRLEIYEEMPHVWQLFSFLPSAKEAIRRTALFVIDAQQRAINNNSPIKMKGWCVQVDSNGQAKTISW